MAQSASAEFGSYAFVHPVVRQLPPAQLIAFEQGLLRTFGRAYPILMPLGGVVLIVHAAWGGGAGGPALWRWLAVVAWAAATATTLIVNVPINSATGVTRSRTAPLMAPRTLGTMSQYIRGAVSRSSRR